MARLERLRIVVFQEGDWLCAQYVDFDLAAQARTLPALYRAVAKLIRGHVAVRRRFTRAPFADLPPAPRKYREMFEQSKIELPAQFVPIPTKADGVSLPRPTVRIAVTSAA